MYKAVTLAVLALAVTLPCSATKKKTPYEFDGRVGTVVFLNDSMYPVSLYLTHPDTGAGYPGDDYAFTADGGSSTTLTLNGAQLNLGSDWGVRLGSSPVKGLGAVSKWDSARNRFTVTVRDFFKESH